MLNKKLGKVDGMPVSWGGGWLIQDYQLQYLQGRIFTIIESMGLKDSQEQSVKDLMKGEIFKLQDFALWISSEKHTELREEYHRVMGEKGYTPTPTISRG